MPAAQQPVPAPSPRRAPRRRRAIALSAIAALLLAAAPATVRRARRTAPEPVRTAFLAMGTVGEIAVAGADAPAAEAAARAAIARIEELEAAYSAFRPDSLVARLGAGREVALDDAGRRLFELLRRVCDASDGAFDPTVGPLLRLWGFRGGDAPASVPADADIAAALARCGWRRLRLRDGDGQAAAYARCEQGATLDLGGIAKGFAVDEAFDAACDAAPDAAGILVNLGGNLRAAGAPRPDADGWTVAVRDPFLPYGRGSVDTLTLSDGLATATSGGYEQFVEIGGERLPHILDPRTGRPARGVAQATVAAPSAAVADALSTACFVLGPDASEALLAAFPGARALFVLEDGSRRRTGAAAPSAPPTSPPSP